MDWSFAVLVRGGDDIVPAAVRAGADGRDDVPVRAAEFDELGLTQASTLMLCRDGILVDACIGLASPSEIARFFAPVADLRIPDSFKQLANTSRGLAWISQK
jgi:hypothetical protein